MTVRAYIEPVGRIETLSISKKRELIQLERKNVKRVVFHELLKLMEIYQENEKNESFKYDACEVEILKEEPTDGLTDGLQLSF